MANAKPIKIGAQQYSDTSPFIVQGVILLVSGANNMLYNFLYRTPWGSLTKDP
jgi:hypothetical protein